MTRTEWLENLCVREINLVHNYIAGMSNYPMKNSGRAHNGFLYTIEGHETYHFKDVDVCAFPNSVVFVPKGENYSISFSGERGSVICFDFEAESCEGMRPFSLSADSEPRLASFFLDAEKKWRVRKRESLAECKAYFYSIVSSLMRIEQQSVTSDAYSKISKALFYLQDHYLEPDFRISDLSKMLGISPRYFEMLFLKEFGISPKDYVSHLKMELAKELILSEKSSITDVAFKLGYSDIYHFTKIFKAKTGFSPSEYRRRNR